MNDSSTTLRFECAKCGVFSTNIPRITSGGDIVCPECGGVKVRALDFPTHHVDVATYTIANYHGTRYAAAPNPPFSWPDIADDAITDEPLPRRTQTEPIIGYRRWATQAIDDFRLRSLTVDHTWEGPVCRNEHPPAEEAPHYMDDESPSAHGIYASSSLSEVVIGGGSWIVGAVSLSGTIIVHETGYRAQCATIRALVLAPAVALMMDGDARQHMADRYQCDVTTDPRDLLPDEKREE